MNELEWPACRFGLGVHKESKSPSNEFSSLRYAAGISPVFLHTSTSIKNSIGETFSILARGLIMKLLSSLGCALMSVCALICQLIGCRRRSTYIYIIASVHCKVDKLVFCCRLASVRSTPVRFLDIHCCASLLATCKLLARSHSLRLVRGESRRNSGESNQKGAEKLAIY